MGWIRRILLLPFSLLFGSIVWIRRAYFNAFNQRYSPSIPTLLVGNLAVGGTGKTPMIIYLLGLLKPNFNVAVLSRGYGRKSKGFKEVLTHSTWQEVGDEPLEIKQSTGCLVFVCEDRVLGVQRIQELHPEVNLVLLDDGYQHLPLKTKTSVILSDYNHLFYNDLPMPSGRLREFPSAISEASMVVVSKCPSEIEVSQKTEILQRMQKWGKPVYFARYVISTPAYIAGYDSVMSQNAVLVTGIVGGQKLREKLSDRFTIEKHFNYGDHSEFTPVMVNEWIDFCKKRKISSIILTRKDCMRLGDMLGNDVLNKNGLTLFEVHTEVQIMNNSSEEFYKEITKEII